MSFEEIRERVARAATCTTADIDKHQAFELVMQMAYEDVPILLAAVDEKEQLARYDLRLRSIDRSAGEPISTCCQPDCSEVARWSLWLKTPDESPTFVRCHRHALSLLNRAADRRKR